MSEPYDLPNLRHHRDQMSLTLNDLTARWSQTLEEMYRAERRIVELEAQLAESKALLEDVPDDQIVGNIWLDRRHALLWPTHEPKEVQP